MKGFCIVVVLAIVADTAFAEGGGPPMITDDTGTPGPGGWEINAAATAVRTRAGSETELPLLDINYGIGERIQLKYEVPWTKVHEAGESTRSRLGDSLLGVKWRFYDAGEDHWRISTYPQIELSSAAEGKTLLLPIELDRHFEAFDLTVEAGRERPAHEAGSWFAGAVVGRSLNEEVQLLAEVRAGEIQSDEFSRFAVIAGARIGGMPMGTLLVSLGREVGGGSAPRASFLGYLGWQFAKN
jgi:hypothetical protein